VSSDEGYDLDWTTPQCVLCLRLIGLSFDLFDGAQKEESLGPDELRYRLKTLPPPLEILAYSYFYGAFLAGPQFPFQRYKTAVTGEAFQSKEAQHPSKEPPPCLLPVLRAFFLGVLFMAVYNVGAAAYPDEFMKQDEYYESPLYFRVYYLVACLFFVLTKYIGVWLMAEGSCILFGLGFNGYEKDGTPRWDGLSNIRPFDFIFATNHQQVIDSFNINTNDWVKRYIFKRLRFLNNRHISQGSTLLFLAIWHGLSLGYFLCFLLEFVYMECEARWKALSNKYTAPYYQPNRTVVQAVIGTVLGVLFWVCRMLGMHFSFVPFSFKSIGRSLQIYNSVYWYGAVVCLLIFLAHPKTPAPARRPPPASAVGVTKKQE